MSRGAACGPSFGMGLDVESSRGPGMGFPLGFGTSLDLVCDGPVGSEYSTNVLLWSRGSCHIWGHDLMRQRRMVSFRGGQGGSRTATTGEESPGSVGGAPSGGMDSCLRRKDGRGMAVWGGPRSTLRSASADLQQAQGERPLPGFRLGGRNDGGCSGVGD